MRTSASSTSSGSTSSAAAAAPRPRTCAPSPIASARARPSPRTPEYEPSCSSIYSPVTVPPGARVPGHRRAHERQRLQEVPRRDARGRLGHVRADGARAGEGRRARARRVRRLRRPRRRRRHARDRQPLRHAGRAPAGVRLHRARGARGGPPALRRQGDPQLRQPRGGRGRRASASTACMSLAREYGAAVICLAIDEEGQARTADDKLRDLPPHLRPRRSSATASIPPT